ncbi:MAG: hypothetical protein R3C24_01650 [Cyanobacteriota/Melainabacteria group bacterium]|nr:hypothetical protein [Candidatus Obscuribacterales bacterium]
MKNVPLQTIWMSILFGVLLATAPNWINKEPTSSYEAPWVHPAASR